MIQCNIFFQPYFEAAWWTHGTLYWKRFYIYLQDEEQFFRELTAKYLEPLSENKKEQKNMANKLKEFRNKVTMCAFKWRIKPHVGKMLWWCWWCFDDADDVNNNKNKMNPFFFLFLQITFVYFIFNTFWLLATFTLQLSKSPVFIQVPKVDINLHYTGEYITIGPVGFMFLLTFIFLVLIQFLAMLHHR